MMNMSRRTGWVAAAVLSLSMFAVAAPAFAQEISPDQLALARKYVDLTDKVDVYANSITDVAARTLQQLLKLNPTIGNDASAAVTEVVNQYKGHRADLVDQISRVYAQKFTADELTQIVAFYSSPTGQKLATSNFEINQQLGRVMQIFQANLATEFYAKVRAVLKAKNLLN